MRKIKRRICVFTFIAMLFVQVPSYAGENENLDLGVPNYPDVKVKPTQEFMDAHPILNQSMKRNGEVQLIKLGVENLSPEHWASLVPEQVPDMRSICPACKEQNWIFDYNDPDHIKCGNCNRVFPDNPDYEEQTVTMKTPWGTDTEIQFYQDAEGKRYYLRGQLDVSRFKFLDKKPKDLARAWYQHKDVDPVKAAYYASCVEAILLEYAKVYPKYLPVKKNNRYYDTGAPHIQDGEVVPDSKPAFPHQGSLWIRWPWTGSIPSEIADVYDICYASPGMDQLVEGENKTLREMIEDNIFDTAVNYIQSYEWTYHIRDNTQMHFRKILELARICGRPDYARFVNDWIAYSQTKYDTGWDIVSTQGVPYHHFWAYNPIAAAEKLAYYSDPLGYVDEKGGRLDYTDQRSSPNMQRMIWNTGALILPDGFMTPVHDFTRNRSASTARIKESETRILAGFGEAVLADGSDEKQVEAHLHWSGGHNHAHNDMLNFYFWGQGRELFGDAIEKTSARHSVVHVDGLQAFKNDLSHDNRGNLEWYTPNFKGISVVRTDGTPGMIHDNGSVRASRYRRTLALNTMDINHPYVVDIFEVEGGKKHDYFLVGAVEESQNLNSNLSLVPDSSFTAYEMSNASRAILDKDGYVDFSFNDGSGVGTRSYFQKDSSMELIAGKGSPLAKNDSGDLVTQLLIRREDSKGNLKSVFVALHEAMAGETSIESFQHEWLSEDSLGITVVTKSGRSDYYLVSLNGKQSMTHGPVNTDSEFAAASIQGIATDLWMVGGTSTSANGKAITSANADYVGNVSNPTRLQTGDDRDSFLTDAGLPVGESLAGEVAILEFLDDQGKVLFVNPFTILSVESENGLQRVIVSEDVAFTIEDKKVIEGFKNWREAATIRLRVRNNITSIPKPKVNGDDLYFPVDFIPNVTLKDGHTLDWFTNGNPDNTQIAINGGDFMPAASTNKLINSDQRITNIQIKEENTNGIYPTETYTYNVLTSFPAQNISGLQDGIWISEDSTAKKHLVSQLSNPQTGGRTAITDGYLNVPATGLYTIYFHSTGGRMWIDDTLVVDSTSMKNTNLYVEVEIYLEEGLHKLDIESYRGEVSLDWKGPGIPRQIIPAMFYKSLPDSEASVQENFAPIIKTLNVPKTLRVGESATISVEATDADQDSIYYTWSKAKGIGSVKFTEGVSNSTNVIFNQAGIYTIQVSVSDGKTVTLQQATITVSDSTISTYDIAVTSGVNGSVTPEGIVAVNEGSDLVVTITPDTGYEVADVLIDGASIGAVSSYTFNNIMDTYSIKVSFKPIPLNNNVNLSDLSLSAGSLTPIFDSGITSYTLDVANTVSQTTITAIADSELHRELTIDGIPATSGISTSPIVLEVGSNVIDIVVTAEDGTTKTYTITITRADVSSDTSLYLDWELDGNTDDSSGNKRIGVLSGTENWVSGYNNGGLEFNGIDNRMQYDMPQTTLSQFTVSLWVRSGADGQPDNTGVFNNNSNGSDFQIDMDGKNNFRYNGNGATKTKFGEAPLNQWVHLAVVCDGVDTHLYYNGTKVATVEGIANTDFGKIDLGVNRGNSKFFKGTLDELRVYDKALTEDEVASLAEVLVNAVPQANDDSYTVGNGQVLSITAVNGVLANDIDADQGDSLTALLVSNPSNGSLSLNRDGSFDYTPNADFRGVDTFSYKVSDGKDDSALATVSITVEPPIQVDPDPEVDPNLYLHWELNGNTDDSSGNNRIGTLSGTESWVDGYSNQGLETNGIDNRIQYDMPKTTLNQFTVSLWARSGADGQSDNTGVFNNNSSGSDFQIDMDGKNNFRYNGNGATKTKFGEAPLNQWVHLAVVCDGVDTHLYYNGTKVATVDGIANTDFGKIDLGVNRGNSKFFKGTLDELRVFDKALTDTEVTELFNLIPVN